MSPETVPENHVDDVVKLSFFTEIGTAIASADTIKQVMDLVMEKIGAIFAPLNWSLLLRNGKTGELLFKCVIGESSDKLKGMKIPAGEGIAGWIAESGRSVIIENVKKDKRFTKRIDRMTGFETQSIIGVPLKAKGRVFGVIELINKLNGESFSPYELKILSTIADFSAIAIEKIYFFRAFKKLASIDPLTGVFNRRSLEKSLAREIERCKRYNNPLAVLWIDLDDFKKINDSFGHLAGDKVLQQTARILERNLRSVDTVTRYGGDEFVVLLPNTSKEEAEKARQRILDDLDKHNTRHKELPFTMTIGLYSAGPDGVEDILSYSDLDLYRQKYRKEETGFENMDEYLGDFMAEEESE